MPPPRGEPGGHRSPHGYATSRLCGGRVLSDGRPPAGLDETIPRRAGPRRRVPLVHPGNSAYWFRRVGSHPVYEPLRTEAARLAEGAPAPAAFLTRQRDWDPFAFVDLCEASYGDKAPCHDLCRQVQRAEWELLFASCYERAVGAT
jgi:hypothetical protein